MPFHFQRRLREAGRSLGLVAVIGAHPVHFLPQVVARYQKEGLVSRACQSYKPCFLSFYTTCENRHLRCPNRWLVCWLKRVYAG